MKVYTMRFAQNLPTSMEEAWNFFSSPRNLATITPSMGFHITSDLDEKQKMYSGMLIGYKITPLMGIRMNWLTEITYIEHHKYFIDEQRSGPFSLWHHEHHFRQIERGIKMTDILSYGIPFGPIGRIANSLVVKNRILDIFSFRRLKIDEIFGEYQRALN
jgi:ligand-binding SRPBCC domain-containing protein